VFGEGDESPRRLYGVDGVSYEVMESGESNVEGSSSLPLKPSAGEGGRSVCRAGVGGARSRSVGAGGIGALFM